MNNLLRWFDSLCVPVKRSARSQTRLVLEKYPTRLALAYLLAASKAG